MQRLGLIGHSLQRDRVRHEFIVDDGFLLIGGVVGSKQSIPAKGQVFGELVVSLDLGRALMHGTTQGVAHYRVRGLSEEKHPIEEPCKSRTCTRLAIGRWAFCIVFGTSKRVFARKRASGVTELSMKHLYRVFFLHRSDYPNTRFRLVANLCRAGLIPAGFHQKFSVVFSFT